MAKSLSRGRQQYVGYVGSLGLLNIQVLLPTVQTATNHPTNQPASHYNKSTNQSNNSRDSEKGRAEEGNLLDIAVFYLRTMCFLKPVLTDSCTL